MLGCEGARREDRGNFDLKVKWCDFKTILKLIVSSFAGWLLSTAREVKAEQER